MLVESVNMEKAMWRRWTFTGVNKEMLPCWGRALFTRPKREKYRFWNVLKHLWEFFKQK